MLLDWLFPFQSNTTATTDRYAALDATHILGTIARLEKRIEERFSESGLLQVCREFNGIASSSDMLARRLSRPIWPVRVAAFLAIVLLILVAVSAVGVLLQRFHLGVEGVSDLLQATEAALNELIFLGLALFFLVNLETRLKRFAALRALHRLRSLAHVVDMHQLTKDPAYLFGNATDTHSSPQRVLTRYELTRYLDYCSEMLALLSKVAALFAQNVEDEVVLNAVNDLESLTQGLSAKIWQKIMILDLAEDHRK